MIDTSEVIETIRMIESENLDIRTITMGISLRDCPDPDGDAARKKIYDKITHHAENLVRVGDDIALEFGVPIVNKRIFVTPIATIAEASREEDFVQYDRILDEAAIGVANNKTTAVRIIPVTGKKVGDVVEFGGLLGKAPIMAVSRFSSAAFIERGGSIPAPISSLRN